MKGITEHVVKDGVLTGEYRVCRRPRGWSTIDCEWGRNVPWEAVVDRYEKAKEWLDSDK